MDAGEEPPTSSWAVRVRRASCSIPSPRQISGHAGAPAPVVGYIARALAALVSALRLCHQAYGVHGACAGCVHSARALGSALKRLFMDYGRSASRLQSYQPNDTGGIQSLWTLRILLCHSVFPGIQSCINCKCTVQARFWSHLSKNTLMNERIWIIRVRSFLYACETKKCSYRGCLHVRTLCSVSKCHR